MEGNKKEKKKWSKKKKIIVWSIVGILLLGAFGSGEEDTNTSDKDTNKQVATEKKETSEEKAAREQKEKEEREAKEQAQLLEEETKYGHLLAEGTSYATYSVEDKALFQMLISDFYGLGIQFQNKYNDKFKTLEAEYEVGKYDTGITWEDIARNGLEGQFCKFEGTIIQLMNGEGYKQYRVAINDDYDKIMLVEIKNGLIDTNLLKDDIIAFKGYSYGNVTYETVLGAEQTIPAVVAEHVELK